MRRIFLLEILKHSMSRMFCLELHVIQCSKCFHLETFNAPRFRISNVSKLRISKLLNSSSIRLNMKNVEVADFQTWTFSNIRISKQRPRNERSWTSHYCVTRKNLHADHCASLRTSRQVLDTLRCTFLMPTCVKESKSVNGKLRKERKLMQMREHVPLLSSFQKS